MELLSKVISEISGTSSSHSEQVSCVIREELTHILSELMERAEDISSAMISSVDGIAWAQMLDEGFDQHRFAAMSSALLALSDNLAREGNTGSTKNVMIEGDNGKIFVMHAGNNLLLTVFTKAGANLGIPLAFAKQAAEKVEYLVIDQKSIEPQPAA